MKRIVLVLMLAALLVLMVAPAASAHVHGITPLGAECPGLPDDGNSGANAAEGDPIGGLIPRDVGNAPLTLGDGGGSLQGINPLCPAV